MFNTILVATDGSALSETAIHAAVAFAKLNGAKLVGLAVAEPQHYAPPTEGGSLIDFNEFVEQISARALCDVQKVADAAAQEGVICTTRTAMSSKPFEKIIGTARQFNCEIIFMASHTRTGLRRLFGGKQVQKVLENSDIPVWIIVGEAG